MPNQLINIISSSLGRQDMPVSHCYSVMDSWAPTTSWWSGCSPSSWHFFQSYPHLALTRAPERWQLLLRSSRGPKDWVLQCRRRTYFSLITDGWMSTATHHHLLTGNQRPPLLIPAGHANGLQLWPQIPWKKHSSTWFASSLECPILLLGCQIIHFYMDTSYNFTHS